MKKLFTAIVVALLAMMAADAHAEDILETIPIVGMDPSRIRMTEGLHYSGSTFAERAGPKERVVVDVGKNVKLPNPAKYYAVTHIAIEEKRDNPCRISLWGRMIDPRFRTPDRKLGQFTLDTCNIDKDLVRALSENRINDKEITGYSGHENQFVRGLRVCMGGARDALGDATKIKGLRLQPAEVAEFRSPIVQSQEEMHGSQQTHCPDTGKTDPDAGWSKWNMCPDGQILTGVEVYFFEKEFRALGARCKGVMLQQRLAAPVKDAIGF